jgi:hypothetical protein
MSVLSGKTKASSMSSNNVEELPRRRTERAQWMDVGKYFQFSRIYDGEAATQCREGRIALSSHLRHHLMLLRLFSLRLSSPHTTQGCPPRVQRS